MDGRDIELAGISCCDRCGYCAPDISQGPPVAAEVIKSASYRAQKDDRNFPGHANLFLCYALIQEAAHDYVLAAGAAKRAAWVCDDIADEIAADVCRLRALEYIKLAQANGDSFVKGPAGYEEIVLADLLRRSGQFEMVAPICEKGLLRNLDDDKIKQALIFQRQLALEQDSGHYTFADVANPEQRHKQLSYPIIIGKLLLERGFILAFAIFLFGGIGMGIARWVSLINFGPDKGLSAWVSIWLISAGIVCPVEIARRFLGIANQKAPANLPAALIIAVMGLCTIVGWQIGSTTLQGLDGAIWGAIGGALGSQTIRGFVDATELPRLRRTIIYPRGQKNVL